MEDLEASFGGGRMSKEFKTKYTPTKTVTYHYGSDELKRIGTACATRLPPASAVHAMFLYELKRQSEVESLFQGELFRLAQTESTSNDHEARIQKLEEQLKVTQRALQVKDVEERLATSKVRMNQQQARIDECAAKNASHTKQLADVMLKIDEYHKARKAGEETATTAAELLEEVTTIKTEVDVLFGERDAMLDMIQEGGTRISKLEDLVRNLTLQLSTGSSPAISPALTQRLPLQTTNGHTVDLLVPKGNGITTAKENRVPVIKSFTPGQPWDG